MGTEEKNVNRLGIGNLLLWSATGASGAVQVVLLSFVTLYCTNALGLPAALVGTLFMLTKIFDGFTDLIAGYIVDKTNTKLGRGRPYDLCIIGLWITTYLLYAVPTQLSTVAKCVWIFICYSLCQSVFKTFMNAAGTPYMVRAFNNEQKYITLNSIGGIITTACVVVFNVIFPMFYAKIIFDAAGWSKLIGTIAIPLCIIGLLRFFFIPEKYQVDATSQHTKLSDVITLLKTNKYIYPIAVVNLVVGISSNMSVGSYYFLYIVKNVEISGALSMIGMLAMLSMAFYPMLLKKISTKQLIQGGLLLTLVSGAVSWFAMDRIPLLGLATFIAGCANLPSSYMAGILIIDCADYNEWKGNARMEGTLSSVTGFSNKVGAALGTFVMGIMLTASGFDGNLEIQTTAANTMIRFIYAWIPAIFAMIGFAGMSFYKLDKQKAQISADLEIRRTQKGGVNNERE